MPTLWVVRAGRGGVHAERFLSGGFIEVGFGASFLGAKGIGLSYEAILQAYKEHAPDQKLGALINASRQLTRFFEELELGDDVVTYDPSQREYLLGTLKGPVTFVPESEEHEPRYRRGVEWTQRVNRESLSVETKNTLGSTLTLFRPNEDAAKEIRERSVPLQASPQVPVEVVPPAENADTLDAAQEQKSHDFIEDKIAELDPYEMQDLVAGILRGMGYKTRVSPPGPDGGHDIFASPDGLGLAEPRIFVEVKHRKGFIGAPAIRSFLGGRRPGDRCLYVSTGGFTKDAKNEAMRAAVPLTLVDLAELRELLVDHYEKLDSAAKRLVPLKRLYWPIEESC